MTKTFETMTPSELALYLLRAYDRDHLTDEMMNKAILRIESDGQKVDWSRF